MSLESIVIGDTRLFLGALTDGIPIGVTGEMAVLLPAFSREECALALSMIPALLEKNCRQIVCVGNLAEQLHDGSDNVVEDLHRSDVVTTFYTDVDAACEYFVFAVGPLTQTLLALVSGHPPLVDALRKAGMERIADFH